jgi:DNA-binding NtrC family response regulator
VSRILLIDADPGERLILRSRLNDLGHEVLVADSGAKGLVEARTSATDLVVLATDLGGGVDGAEVCRRLKAMPGLARIPVVAYATRAVSGEVVGCMFDAGCEAFLGRDQMPNLDRVLEVQLKIKAQGDELAKQNRALERENRRLGEERQRAAEGGGEGAGSGDQVFRELAAGRPDGVLLVDDGGVVRRADRGACELLGGRLQGATLGKIAPGCGLEAFVRDARTTPREGFRFDTSARKDRCKRSLMASVLPVAAGNESHTQRVVLLLDLGKRRVAEEMLRAQEPGIPRQQLGSLVEAARSVFVPEALIGSAESTTRTRGRIVRAAAGDAPLLLTGERGVGKELAARILHYSGPRTGCFLQLRCAARDTESLELELFGAAGAEPKGKGADRGKAGMMLLAQDGTLFLGEIAELPLALQERLLGVLETGMLKRAGAKKKEPVSCRLVASTSQNLAALAAAGKFHPGLAEVLGASVIHLPALRDRRQDVAELAASFVARFGARHGVTALSEECAWIMEQYDWPGNVVELEDCVEQACARASGGLINASHLTRPLRDLAHDLPGSEVIPMASVARTQPGAPTLPGTHVVAAAPRALKAWEITDADPINLDLYEKKALLRALDITGGDKLAAARLLEVGKSTLYRKLKKFGIS